MASGWGGDMSAALEFQKQVKRGDLQDNRYRHGGNSRARGGTSSPMARAAPGSARPVATAGPSPRATTNNWEAKLATKLPDRYYKKHDEQSVASAGGGNTSTVSTPASGGMTSSWAPTAVKDVNPLVANAPATGGPDSSAWSVPFSENVGSRESKTQQASVGTATSSWVPSANNDNDIPKASSGGLAASIWANAPAVPNASQTGPSVFSVGSRARNEPQPVVQTAAASRVPVMEQTSQAKSAGGGLQNSRWAQPSLVSVTSNTQYPPYNPVFDVDEGAYRDDNWLYTYHTEHGGRIYGVAADNAAAAGDFEAEQALRTVARRAKEIVEARIKLRDQKKEDEARALANHAVAVAKAHFNKYHPPLPAKPQRLEDVSKTAAGPDYAPFDMSSAPKQPQVTATKPFVDGGFDCKQEPKGEPKDQHAPIQQPVLPQSLATQPAQHFTAQPFQQRVSTSIYQDPVIQQPAFTQPVTNRPVQQNNFGQSSGFPATFDDPAAVQLFQKWMSQGGHK